MPELADIWNVLILRDYNTRLVVICTMLLGCACGLMGGFLLLRKRSLMGDTLSHATLPGVGLSFMLLVALGGDGKSLPILLAGAGITGVIGCAAVLFIREQTRIKDDAAMGIVLSVFFGAGVAILGVIQTMPEGSAAGLESFIYGKTASMVMSDFQILVLVTVCVITCSILLFKELRLLCFDEHFAAALGWPVKFLDILLLALIFVEHESASLGERHIMAAHDHIGEEACVLRQREGGGLPASMGSLGLPQRSSRWMPE